MASYNRADNFRRANPHPLEKPRTPHPAMAAHNPDSGAAQPHLPTEAATGQSDHHLFGDLRHRIQHNLDLARADALRHHG